MMMAGEMEVHASSVGRTCFLVGPPAFAADVLAAMTNKQSHDDGRLSDDEIQWLEARSEGFGIITTAATSMEDGKGWG